MMNEDPPNEMPRWRMRAETYCADLGLGSYDDLSPEMQETVRNGLRDELDALGLIPVGGSLEDYV